MNLVLFSLSTCILGPVVKDVSTQITRPASQNEGPDLGGRGQELGSVVLYGDNTETSSSSVPTSCPPPPFLFPFHRLSSPSLCFCVHICIYTYGDSIRIVCYNTCVYHFLLRHDTYHVYILRIKSCRTDYYTYSLVVRFDGLSPTDGGKITLVVELSDSRPITSSCPEDIFTSHVKKSLCCSVKTQTFFVVRKLTSLFCGTTWMVVKHVWTHVVLTKTVCSTIRFQPSYPDPSLKVFENLGIL